jgi:hypothetical protein
MQFLFMGQFEWQRLQNELPYSRRFEGKHMKINLEVPQEGILWVNSKLFKLYR